MVDTLQRPRAVAVAAALPEPRACDACGYEVIEVRRLDFCPMCGAVPERMWRDSGLLAAAPAA